MHKCSPFIQVLYNSLRGLHQISSTTIQTVSIFKLFLRTESWYAISKLILWNKSKTPFIIQKYTPKELNRRETNLQKMSEKIVKWICVIAALSPWWIKNPTVDFKRLLPAVTDFKRKIDGAGKRLPQTPVRVGGEVCSSTCWSLRRSLLIVCSGAHGEQNRSRTLSDWNHRCLSERLRVCKCRLLHKTQS